MPEAPGEGEGLSAELETRTCAHPDCDRTFRVTPSNTLNYHCGLHHKHGGKLFHAYAADEHGMRRAEKPTRQPTPPPGWPHRRRKRAKPPLPDPSDVD